MEQYFPVQLFVMFYNVILMSLWMKFQSVATQSTVPKKMATGTFTHSS